MKNLLVIIFTFCTLAAFGQYTTNSVEREGFVFGFSIGGGAISIADSDQENPFDEAQGAISLPNLKFGWMLNDRLALMATFHGLIYEYEGSDRSFDAITPSLQYWIKDRWWINGGFGLAIDGPALYEIDDLDEEDWNFGCAVVASTGYEMVQRRNFTIDLQTKVQLGRTFMEGDRHRDGAAFSVGIGFNWY